MKTFYLIIFSVILLAFSGCNPSSISEKDVISVSIIPQKFFVQQIAGSEQPINIMIPSGASPATYEPTPKQLVQLSNSAIYFKIGHIEFEKSWMEKIKSTNASMKIYDVSDKIELIEGEASHHGDHDHSSGADPHIWVSPKQVKIIAQNIYNDLITEYPDKQGIYENNFNLFIDSLNKLDLYIENAIANLPNKYFLIFHPALTYFAKDYGLKQISIELEGKKPSAEHLKNVIDLIKEKNIKVILIQQEFDIENAEAIAKETGIKVVQINPLSENWFEETIKLVSVFKTYNN